MSIPRGLVALLVVALLIGVPYSCVRAISQHRAAYPGELIFISEANIFFGTEYQSVYWHHNPRIANEYPENLTIHMDNHTFNISELTPDLVTELGGSLIQGGWRDAQGNTLSYKFEDDRLVHFAFDSMYRRFYDEKPEKYDFDAITISLNQGEPFSVPISHSDLVRYCGKPERKYLQFVQ